LNNKIKVTLSSGLVFVLSLVLIIPNLAMEFLPSSEGDTRMYYSIGMPKETSISTMNEKMKEIEAMFFESNDAEGNPQFTTVESLVGYVWGTEPIPYRSTLFVEASANSDANAVLNEYKDKIIYLLPEKSVVDGGLLSSMDGSMGTDFSYSLKGEDLLLLQQAA